jgi:hypothetical protein
MSATIDWTPVSGNLLVFAVGGDKDLGTLTLTGWSTPVNLRSTSVSLIIAYKTSDGTETAVSGTVTGANTAGSNTWVAEYAQTGAGAWGLRGTAGTHNTDESNVSAWDTGTTGTLDGDAVAIGAWAIDSVNTAGTPAYTNGYTQVRVTGNGSGQAGLWVAHLLTASSGNTYTETLTLTGRTPTDQMSGGIVALGRNPGGAAVAPSSITSTEAFGTTVVSQAVVGTGVAGDEAFGTATVARGATIEASGITSAEAVGSHVVVTTQILTLTGVVTAEGFGSHTVTMGITVAPAGAASAETFGSAQLHSSPFTVQADNHFIPGGTLTFDAPLPNTTAHAGNAIVFVLVGDKNIGTLTLNGLGWNVPVNLRSTSLSLVIAWREAVGGEAGADGSFTTGNPGGSQIYISEIDSDDPGVWALKASASNNTNETNVTAWSTGTSGVAVGDGKVIAAFGVDSFKSDTIDTFSNGFTTLFAQSTGDAETGMWVAQHGAVTGVAYESTLTRTVFVDPVVADQMSAALIILGKAFVQDLAPVGIEPGEAFGVTVIPGPLEPGGIASAEAFGSLTIAVGALIIVPVGVGSGEGLGTPVLSSGFVIQAIGVVSSEAFGTHVVAIGARKFWLGGVHVEAVKLGGQTVTAGYVGAALVW